VRLALASLLVFLDSEPLLARVWLVEALAAGDSALEHRERNIAALQTLVPQRYPLARSSSSTPLAAHAAIASTLAVIHSHIVARKPDRLIQLLGPLMGQITATYLPPAAVAREVRRAEELALEILAGRVSPPYPGASEELPPPIPAMSEIRALTASGNACST
jgi:hypothetical protein